MTRLVAHLLAHLRQKAGHVDDGPPDSAAPDLLLAVIRSHAHGVEATIKGLELRVCAYAHSDAGCGAMLDVYRDAHGNLAFFAKGLEREETCGFHESDHVGSGVDGRKFGMMRGQGMLQFNGLLCLASDTDGDVMGHWEMIVQKTELGGAGIRHRIQCER